MSVQENKLKAIADAIREKDGTTDPIPANDFPARIRTIPTGTLPDNVRTITLSADPPEGGTVSGAGLAQDGMTVTVKAEAANGYNSAGWQEKEQLVNENSEYTFTVAENRKLVAVFEAKPTSRLPEGYTEVEYIESTDGNRKSINTTQQYSEKSRCVLRFSFSESPPNNRFLIYARGYRILSGKYYYTILSTYTNNGNIHGYVVQGGSARFDNNISTGVPTVPITLDIDLPNKTISLGESSFNISALSSNTVNPTIFIFGAENTDGSTPIGKLYSYKYYENGSLIQDMVPCINPDNIVGLYDIVNNEFFTSSTTYNYTAGPAI